jgi:hypothetical protein
MGTYRRMITHVRSIDDCLHCEWLPPSAERDDSRNGAGRVVRISINPHTCKSQPFFSEVQAHDQAPVFLSHSSNSMGRRVSCIITYYYAVSAGQRCVV